MNNLEGYYRGRTSGGIANDDTGLAQMVKYVSKDNEHYIRTWYVGGIRNGDFEDMTGNAKEIVLDTSTMMYMSYKGNFVAGNRENNDDLETGLSQADIDRIVSSYPVDYPSEWYFDGE